MIEEAFKNVAPYISELNKVREFVEAHRNMPFDEVVAELEKEIEKVNIPLKTDFKILLTEMERLRRERMQDV